MRMFVSLGEDGSTPQKDGQVSRVLLRNTWALWGVMLHRFSWLNDVTGELKSPHLFVPNQDHDLTSRLSPEVKQTFAYSFWAGTRMQHLFCKVGTGKPKKASLIKFMKSP